MMPNVFSPRHRQGKSPHAIGGFCLFLVWLVAAAAHAGPASVRAFLDHDHAELGDTVTLNIEVDGDAHVAAPDVSALKSDFDILGRSHNTRWQIVNGQATVKSLWAVQLRPRHAGKLVIPSLRVAGQTTRPLQLTVSKAASSTRAGPGKPAFLRVETDTRTPYVGQQVAVTVKLFYVSAMTRGSLDVAHAGKLDVREMGKPARYRAQRGGRRYNVLEKHYAVIAHHAGGVDLPRVAFHGAMILPGGYANFFGHTRPVEARSQPIHFDVRARPSSHGKGAWLPARAFSLKLTGLPADGKVQQGEPVTLTLEEKATGLPFESLPTLRLPQVKGWSVYPEKASKHTADQGRWLVGTRTRKFSVVAQRAGTITIPAITLRWWNVKKDKAEVARIPPHTLTVTAGGSHAGAGGAASTTGVAASTTVAGASASSAAVPPARATSVAYTGTRAHVLAWLALALWLITLLVVAIGWWWRRRRADPRRSSPSKPAARPSSPRQQRAEFMDAVRRGDVAAQCDRLLAWARSERPGVPHLGALADALEPGPQPRIVVALQQARYASMAGSQPVDSAAVLRAFRRGFAWRRRTGASADDEPLPPLYPP